MPTLTEKILAAHLTDGEMKPGNERHWENIILISGLLRRHPVKR